MPLNTRGLSNNLTWTLFTLALPPSALWGTLTGAWRHNVLFRRAGNVQLSGENVPQASGYTSAVHHCVCASTESDVRKQNRSLHCHYIYTRFVFLLLWKTFLTLKTYQQSKISGGLSLTWLVWFCCESEITIFKVDKVSRNPVDHIMNVACLEIKSHKWFKDDTKKMASLHELCNWLKWKRKKGNRVTFHINNAIVH